jgi:hypothetical protein
VNPFTPVSDASDVTLLSKKHPKPLPEKQLGVIPDRRPQSATTMTRLAQCELINRGYLPEGHLTGVEDPITKAALSKYLAAELVAGLPSLGDYSNSIKDHFEELARWLEEFETLLAKQSKGSERPTLLDKDKIINLVWGFRVTAR